MSVRVNRESENKGLSAVHVSKTYVRLAWDAVPGAQAYDVLRDGAVVATTGGTGCVDHGLRENRAYTYAVQAKIAENDAEKVGEISVVTQAETVFDAAVCGIAGQGIAFTFTMPDAVEVRVQRDGVLLDTVRRPCGDPVVIEDTPLPFGQVCRYTLTSVDRAGVPGDYTAKLTATAASDDRLASDRVDHRFLSVARTSASAIALTWEPVANAERYRLYRQTDDGVREELRLPGHPGRTCYEDRRVQGGALYTYSIEAVKGDEVFASDPVTATAAPVHTANAAYLPTRWFAGASFPGDDFLADRMRQLHGFGITYLFCDIGCWRCGDGVYRSDYDAAELPRWMAAAERYGMKIVLCVNFVMGDDLSAEVTDRVTAELHDFAVKFVAEGAEFEGARYHAVGFQLDFEPFRRPRQRAFLLETARWLRREFDGIFLSAATPAKNGHYDEAELTEFLNVLDMVNPMIYDTNAPAPAGHETTAEERANGVTRTREEYIDLFCESCLWYTRLIAGSDNPDCILAPTLPVYENRGFAIEGVGFPDPDVPFHTYHCHYQYFREEPLETLPNALQGVWAAKARGAKVDHCGIFFLPSFAGLNRAVYSPEVSAYYDFEQAQRAWMDEWVDRPDGTV